MAGIYHGFRSCQIRSQRLLQPTGSSRFVTAPCTADNVGKVSTRTLPPDVNGADYFEANMFGNLMTGARKRVGGCSRVVEL